MIRARPKYLEVDSFDATNILKRRNYLSADAEGPQMKRPELEDSAAQPRAYTSGPKPIISHSTDSKFQQWMKILSVLPEGRFTGTCHHYIRYIPALPILTGILAPKRLDGAQCGTCGEQHETFMHEDCDPRILNFACILMDRQKEGPAATEKCWLCHKTQSLICTHVRLTYRELAY